MNCPKCGVKSKVIDSRHADSKVAIRPALVTFGRNAVAWYTAEWVVRLRVCRCGWRMRTVEITEDDADVLLKREEECTFGR